MAASLNNEGFLRETAEQHLANQTEDVQIEEHGISREEEDSLLSEGDDKIPSAQVPRHKPTSIDEKSLKNPKVKDQKEIPSTSGPRPNDLCRKDRKRPRVDESAKTRNATGVKRSRQEEEVQSIQERIKNSNSSISFLKNHLDKGTCPKTLRYNARANITPNDDFKQEIGARLCSSGAWSPQATNIWFRATEK